MDVIYSIYLLFVKVNLSSEVDHFNFLNEFLLIFQPERAENLLMEIS